jgi:hypothetical protein
LGTVNFGCTSLTAERIIDITKHLYRNKAEAFGLYYLCDLL